MGVQDRGRHGWRSDAEGSPDFSALRSVMGSRQAGDILGKLSFFIFDMLFEGGEDRRGQPFSERRRLEHAVTDELVQLRLAGALAGGGQPLLTAACRLDLEGIVLKRLDAPYEAVRGGARIAGSRPSAGRRRRWWWAAGR